MKQLDHPNIVKLFEIIDAPTSDKLYLIMPVADYGESIEYDPFFNPYQFVKGSTSPKGPLRQQDSFNIECEAAQTSGDLRLSEQVAQQ